MKLIRGLFLFILFIILSVGGIVGYFYFTIASDVDDAPLHLYTSDVTIDRVIFDLLYEAIEEAEESDQLVLALTQDQINLLIFAAIKEMNPNYKTEDCEDDECLYIATFSDMDETVPVIGGKSVLLKHAYATIEDTEMAFVLTMNVFGIDTNFNVRFKMTSTGGTYKLEILKIALGKLNLAGGFGKFVLKQVMNYTDFNEAMVNQELAEMGLPFTFHVDDLSLRFTKSDIAQMLVNEEADPNDANQVFVNELVSLLLDDQTNLLDVGFFNKQAESAFGLKLDLSLLRYDPLTDGVPVNRLDFEDYKTKILALVTAGVLTEDNHQAISNFILFGYDNITAEEQTIVSALSFASIGIANVTTFIGLATDDSFGDLDLADTLTTQLYMGLSDLSTGEINIQIAETLINPILYNAGLIGVGFRMYSSVHPNSVIYSGIEALWMEIEEDTLRLNMIYNLNGIRLVLSTSFLDESEDALAIDATLDEIRLGTLEFSDEFKDAMMDLLASSMESDGLSLLGVSSNGLVIDGSSFLDDFDSEATLSTLLNLLKEDNRLSLSLVGSNLAANGAIQFMMDLTPLMVSVEEATLPVGVNQPLDQALFITNKTQTLLISNLTDPKAPRIVITEREFNQMIYENTNGYQDFTTSQQLPDGETNFDTIVHGLLFEFTPTVVTIKVILEMNNLVTAIYLPGNVVNNNTSSVDIVLSNTISLGQSLTTSSDFILDLIGDNLDSMSVIRYNAATKTMSLSATSFGEMMAFGGSTSLSATKISIVDGAVVHYVSFDDPALELIFDALTDNFEEIFDANFMNLSLYNTTGAFNTQTVNALNSTMDDVVAIVVDPLLSLNEEDTLSLILAINQLINANQSVYFAEIEAESDLVGGLFTLSDFYALLFQ